MSDEDRQQGLIAQLWTHAWGRVLMMAATVGMVAWALRETADVTLPVVTAVSQVLLPVAVGFTIAYVFQPLMEGLHRRGCNRLLAAGTIYFLAVVLTVLVGSFAIPAMVRQSADLIDRSFAERRFLDLDADGRWASHEPVLIPDANGSLVHDRNGDEIADVGETHYRADDPRVKVAPSVVHSVASWVDEQRRDLRRMVDNELDARGMRFVAFYAQETQALRDVLGDAMRVAADGHSVSQWPESLQAQNLPAIDLAWEGSWPGVEPEELDAVAAALPEHQRERWRQVVAWYGRLWAFQHLQLLAVWNGAEPPPAPAIDMVALAPAARAHAERVLFNPAALAARWASFAASEEAVNEVAQLQMLSQLRTAEQGDRSYAIALLSRLHGSSGGEALSQDLLVRASALLQTGLTHASDFIAAQASDLVTNVGAVLAILLDFFLVPIYAFFLTLAMPGIRRTVKRYVPVRGRERTERILREIERAVSAFFRGRLIVCLICAGLVWVGFMICGVPYPLLFGLVIGLATAVPLSGLLFLVPACVLVMVDGGDMMLWRLSGAVATYALVQTLEMTVFTPTIMGREVELHPVLLIVALLLCGKLLGILGLILAVPIAATARILLREFALPQLRRSAAVHGTARIERPPD
ncbi:MAG: AI-2E family transporter [Planctomycetota bacterium]|nr:AI-2E family transporter [Planctomycetota bacterium]